MALKYFRNGYNCGEVMLKAFNEAHNLGYPADAYKAATGFGLGLGGSGCVCGSVTGAVMVLGLICGRNKIFESERTVYTAVNELHRRFTEKHKCLCCRALTKNVKWNSAGHKTLCESYVLDAASILEDIIEKTLTGCLPQNGTAKKPKIKKNPLAFVQMIRDKLC